MARLQVLHWTMSPPQDRASTRNAMQKHMTRESDLGVWTTLMDIDPRYSLRHQVDELFQRLDETTEDGARADLMDTNHHDDLLWLAAVGEAEDKAASSMPKLSYPAFDKFATVGTTIDNRQDALAQCHAAFAAVEEDFKSTALTRVNVEDALMAEYAPWTLRHLLRTVLRHDAHRLCEEQVAALSAKQVAAAVCRWIHGQEAKRSTLLTPEDEAAIRLNSQEGTQKLVATNSKQRYSVRGADGKWRLKSRQVRRHIVLRARCRSIAAKVEYANTR